MQYTTQFKQLTLGLKKLGGHMHKWRKTLYKCLTRNKGKVTVISLEQCSECGKIIRIRYKEDKTNANRSRNKK